MTKMIEPLLCEALLKFFENLIENLQFVQNLKKWNENSESSNLMIFNVLNLKFLDFL